MADTSQPQYEREPYNADDRQQIARVFGSPLDIPPDWITWLKRKLDLTTDVDPGCCRRLLKRVVGIDTTITTIQGDITTIQGDIAGLGTDCTTGPPPTVYQGTVAYNLYNSAFTQILTMSQTMDVPNYDFYINCGYVFQLRAQVVISPNSVTLMGGAGPTSVGQVGMLAPPNGNYQHLDSGWLDYTDNYDSLHPTNTVSFSFWATGQMELYAGGKLYGRWKLGDASLDPTAGLQLPIARKTANYTLVEGDGVILVDATTGNKTVTLPVIDSGHPFIAGRQYIVKKVDSSANTVTLSQSADGEKIDGANTVVLANQYDSVTVVRNEAAYDWSIIAQVP